MTQSTALPPVITLDSEEYFVDASAAYFRANSDYNEALEDVAQAEDKIRDLRRSISDVESEAIVNGEITGSNAETRKASLALWSAKEPRVIEANGLLRKEELRKSRAEAMRDVASNEMSVQRRRMDAFIAVTNRAAANEANAGAYERGSR